MLAKVLNCSFLDADDFHRLSNKDMMRQGIPLSEEYRIPWLEMLRDVLKENIVGGKMLRFLPEKRAAEWKHFMPVTLPQSQLHLLHIDDAEGIFKVDVTLSPRVIVSTIQALLFSEQVMDKQSF
ncbi:hypothetical protein CRYUN_Cryun14cG0064200 [Craigia yunnanensis]